MTEIVLGIMIPFIGTAAGAALVFLVKNELSVSIQRALNGFAAGVMTAAAIWSLIIPAIEQSSDMGKLSFLPALIGIWLGIFFLLLLDHLVPHLHSSANTAEGPNSRLARTTMMVLAVTLHNIPEGIAVGVVAAGLLNGSVHITLESFIALSVGIALHNAPEGALISVLMRAEGKNKWKSFFYGALSGAVEPIFAVLTIAASSLMIPAMPYLLSFAAGAMLYVVVEELIPEMSHGEHSHAGVITFAVGFTAMMVLDIGLG
jgi:ZIP family zinc transporter